MFSTDKRSVFGKLRIMHNILLTPWSSWSRFSSMGVHRKWRSGHWSRAWVEVSAVTEPHFWQTMIRSHWSRVRGGWGRCGDELVVGGEEKKERKEKEKRN